MRSKAIYLWATLIPLTSSGCIVGGFGNKVWTQPVTEQRSIDTADLNALEIRTHNGSIHFAGQSDSVLKIFSLHRHVPNAGRQLLSLLALDVKGIRLGPALPAFVTPNILKILQDKYDLKGIGTDAKADVLATLGA